MAMLLRRLCKISTLTHILSDTVRPEKDGTLEHGAGVILTNAADNDVKLGAKMDEKKNLRNGCMGEPSTLRAIIACW